MTTDHQSDDHEKVPFGQEGFKKLQTRAKWDEDFGNNLADELEINPRDVLMRSFHFTEIQMKAIANTTDEVLRARTLPIIFAIRAGNPEKLVYKQDPKPKKFHLECVCYVE